MAHPSASSPSSARHHVIESLTIDGGTHFLAVHLPFADGFNCLIGPGGSGKTTILQSLCYAIGATTTDPRVAQNEAHVRATLGTGLLRAGVVSQHGPRYASERRAGEPPRVTDERGEHAPVSLDGDLFRLEMYGQNEIQGMADNPAAQLALLDKFAASELRALEDGIAQVERRIELKAAEVARLEAEIADAGDQTGDLPTVAAALQALTEAAGPDADEAQRAHAARTLRGREQAALRGLRDDVRAVVAAADAFELDAQRRLGAGLSPALAASPNRTALARAHAAAQAARAVVVDAVARARGALSAAETEVTSSGDLLGVAHAAEDAAYDALNRKLDADRGRLAERERLQRRFLELEALEKKLSERRREHAARSAEAQGLRDERARRIGAELVVRRRVAAEISETLRGKLDVTVVAGGDWGEYAAVVTEMLRGSGTRAELVKAIAQNIRPDDLAALVRADDTAPIQAIDDSRTNKAERARKVVDALRASGQVARLDVVRLRDVPVIRLRVGEEYVASTQLSFGQRCMAVLLILLIESAAPLLIDQPEDQLDNAFVYDVLVPTLRVAKTSRQILFASHNPNILVLGEADRVFVLEPKNGHGQLTEHGTIDEVRGSIERLVEGGRQAFLRRSERYGHPARP